MATTKASKKKPKKSMVLNVDGVDLPVTFNTTGRLDKKSQDAFNAILNRTALQNTASRFTARDAVEVAGFGGLVGMIYLGSDIVLQLLSFLKIGELVTDVPEAIGKGIIKTADDITGALGDIADLVTASAFAILPGMPKKDVENARESARVFTEAEITAFNVILEKTKAELRRRAGVAPTSEAEAKMIADIEKLDEQKKKLEAERKAREAKKFESLLFKIKLASAFGGAYVIKKFLESYEFSEAAENAQFL